MEDFSIEDTYQRILTDLKAGKRPRLKLNKDEALSCSHFWHQTLEKKKYSDLTSLLCVLDHSDHHSRELSDLFISTIHQIKTEDKEKDLLVYLLSGSIKHVIEWHGKKGDRAPMSYLNELKVTLHHKNLEVVEWSLRACESLGTQVLLLKDDIISSKPGFLKALNPHTKNINELIRFLSQRWEKTS